MDSQTYVLLTAIASGAVWALWLLANRIIGYPKLSDTSWNYRVSRTRRSIRRASFGIALAFLALSSTKFAVNVETQVREPKNVMFVLDVSRSMDAVDEGFDESRLERAKTFIVRMVNGHPENSHSLTVFAGEAAEAIPKTTDATAFATLLSWISSKYSTSFWTDFTSMGAFVSEKFSALPEDSRPSTLLVVLSDGWDAEDTPKTSALRSAFQKSEGKIRTLSVTYWSEKWAPVPLGKDFMGWVVYQTDKSGNAVISKANHETSKRMAEVTDGTAAYEKEAGKAYEAGLKATMADPSARTTEGGRPFSPFQLLSLLCFIAAFAIPDKIPTWFKKPSSSA